MISQAVCDCGVVLDNEQEIGWYRTTKGNIWNKLKKEMHGNYIYTQKKIPKNANCDTCNNTQK